VAKKSKVDPAGSAKMTKAKASGRSTKTKKPSSRKKVAVGAETAAVARTAFDPTDAQIQMRAYFISERRRRLALPGDANSDWLEAKRQLLSETRL